MAGRTVPPAIGWPLLAVPDENGRLNWPGAERSVREQIEVILRTRPGEQLMRPDYGAGLEDLLHEPNTLTTRRRIRDLIVEHLERHEARVVVDTVEVWEVDGAPGRVRVEIAYRLRRTGVTRQLDLVLELEE
jgi:phage baseplate assembly protein W